MKQFLLSCLMAGSFFSQAQTVTFDNEEDMPPGWLTTAGLTIAPYQAGPPCTPNAGGLVIIPDGSNPVRFLSPTLGLINSNEMVSVVFNYYAFNSSVTFDCGTQQTSSCAKITAYVVDASHESTELPAAPVILGQTTLNNFSTGAPKNINIPVSAALTSSAAFKVLIDIDLGSCGALSYVVDDALISVVEETTTPVSFRSFNAVRNQSKVSLTWTTASEQNNHGFYVQKNDGSGWKDVAFVFSAADGGNSASDLDYAFSDVNNAKGVSQYRLLQVDIDGKAKFSEIRSVKGESQAARVLVYPNPSSTGNVTVVFDGQSIRDIQVNDISGRLIKRYSGVVNNLEINGLRTGVYTLQISDRANGASVVEKVVVK